MCLCKPHSQAMPPSCFPLPQILLLDLSTGAVLWSQALPGLARDPQSASLPTADHRSAFFFWGLHELTSANQMVWAGHTLGGHACATRRSLFEELIG